MIPELGHFALVIALALAAAQSIFGLYGANTWLPGQGSQIGFVIMVVVVVGVTFASILLLQRWQRDRGSA